MKKIILAIVLVVSSVLVANAQLDGKKAIGLRLGYDIEVSYQHPLSDSGRIELGLGTVGFQGFLVNGLYQWVWNIADIQGFNWYAGAGLGLGYWRSFAIGINANIGIEYTFGIPLQLSIDWRPGFFFRTGGWNNRFTYEGFCLGVRYKF